MTLNGRKFLVKNIERISQKRFLKKEAGRKSTELTLTVVILFVWNKLTNTLGSIKTAKKQRSTRKLGFPV